MQNRQVDNKTTFQVRIDIGWHKILHSLRTEPGITFKSLVEDALSATYELRNGKYKKVKV